MFLFRLFLDSFNQKLTLTHQQMAADYEKLRLDDTDKSAKLQELMSVSNMIKPHPTLHSSPKHTSPHNTNNYYSPTHSINQQLTPKHLMRAISPATQKYLNGPDVINNCLLDKSRKNFYNSNQRLNRNLSSQSLVLSSSGDSDDDYNEIEFKKRRGSLTANSSLLATLCRTVPLALPTLQLHLLISLTMVLLTHRCPQYLIVL